MGSARNISVVRGAAPAISITLTYSLSKPAPLTEARVCTQVPHSVGTMTIRFNHTALAAVGAGSRKRVPRTWYLVTWHLDERRWYSSLWRVESFGPTPSASWHAQKFLVWDLRVINVSFVSLHGHIRKWSKDTLWYVWLKPKIDNT